MNNIQRDTLYLMLLMLGVGIVIGVLIAPRGGRRDNHSRHDDKRRSGANLVFGNIVIGSNNAPDSIMSFGYEDTGDTD
jgi:hypothetical protein